MELLFRSKIKKDYKHAIFPQSINLPEFFFSSELFSTLVTYYVVDYFTSFIIPQVLPFTYVMLFGLIILVLVVFHMFCCVINFVNLFHAT